MTRRTTAWNKEKVAGWVEVPDGEAMPIYFVREVTVLQPIGITEQLMFSTTRLTARNGTCGTGYFFNFQLDNAIVPVIITNKHVVNNNPDETMTFQVHLTSDGKTDEGNHSIEFTTHWVFHPNQDLCYTYCNAILEQIPKITRKQVFYRALTSDLIYDEGKLKELSMMEEVVMVGYPTGLYDSTHNYPIFRHGYTAAHPGYDFNNKGIGLIDAACFPGSSGSPVFIINEGSYKDKHGNMNLGTSRVIFLGTQFAVPVMNAEGQIVPKNIPAAMVPVSQTKMMINLGYYIKSYELKAFEPMILNDLMKQAK